jgi:hypothetical protein
MNIDAPTFFNNNKFLVIKNFLSQDMALFFYEYCKLKVQQIDFKQFYDHSNYNKHWDGEFGDAQVPNSYNLYADPVMETILFLSKNKISELTGLNLHINYSYWRFYQLGDILERHKDRNSCEISSTLCLGYDVSNVDSNIFPNYQWPMYVESNGETLPISLNPGDLIIYKGCEIDHWREKFLGLNHAQVFLHYNTVDAFSNKQRHFDGRPLLAIPSIFRNHDTDTN